MKMHQEAMSAEIPFAASHLSWGNFYKKVSHGLICHRVRKCNRWSTDAWDPCVHREQTTTNLTPSYCGSSQNSCLLLHNDAWIKVTFLSAAFCHAAAILVRKSASPYLGSCPTEGQHEGQRWKGCFWRQAQRAAWSHRKPKSFSLLLVNVPTSLSQPDTCISLPSNYILKVSYCHNTSILGKTPRQFWGEILHFRWKKSLNARLKMQNLNQVGDVQTHRGRCSLTPSPLFRGFFFHFPCHNTHLQQTDFHWHS